MICYRDINSVVLSNCNDFFESDYIYDFEDNYDEIYFTTIAKIDGLNRGWVGDITYKPRGGIDIATNEKNDTPLLITVKDVLLVRINVSSPSDSAVEWKYMFLKN